MFQYLKENPTVAIVAIICITVAIVAALTLNYDMSWLPDVIRELIQGEL